MTDISAQDLALKTRDQILWHPDTHRQQVYAEKTSCGTRACVAGWACLLAGYKLLLEAEEYGLTDYVADETGDSDGLDISFLAEELLNLTPRQAAWLFWDCRTHEEVLEGLELIAKDDQDKLNELITHGDSWRDDCSFDDTLELFDEVELIAKGERIICP